MIARTRRRLLVGNWKMNLTEVFGRRLLDDLLPAIEAATTRVDVVVAPAFPVLRAVADRIRGTRVALAAQDVHWEERGAFTGEVSAGMLRELGVRFVIVGHSERRVLLGETDDTVRRKVVACRRHELVPIVCVGEHENERNEGRTLEVVERQVRGGLADLRQVDGHELVIAYEPVWAIGTGRTPSPSEIHQVHRMIREQLGHLYGAAATRIRILYGGSVAPENLYPLLELEEVDGGLVGGASLEAAKFATLVSAAAVGG